MINQINSNRACTIVTLEDPIEIMHTDKKALVNQREIGTDTASFVTGLKHVLRQDPDVIFIGEMRDQETVWAALVRCRDRALRHLDAPHDGCRRNGEPHRRTLPCRTAGADPTLACRRLEGDRLSTTLPQKDGGGRVPAVEVLVANGRVHEAITDPTETRSIPDIIAEGDFYGMQTFDQHLLEMFESDVITMEDALHASTTPHDLRLAMRKAGVA